MVPDNNMMPPMEKCVGAFEKVVGILEIVSAILESMLVASCLREFTKPFIQESYLGSRGCASCFYLAFPGAARYLSTQTYLTMIASGYAGRKQQRIVYDGSKLDRIRNNFDENNIHMDISTLPGC
jgi:hypothetical protein